MLEFQKDIFVEIVKYGIAKKTDLKAFFIALILGDPIKKEKNLSASCLTGQKLL